MKNEEKILLEKFAVKWKQWKYNPIQWMEECAYLPLVGGDQRVKLYQKQKELIYKFYNNHHIITLKSRQIGITTIFKLICAHMTIFFENVTIGIVSRRSSEATEFNKGVKEMISSAEPKPLIPKFIKSTEQSYKLQNGSSLISDCVSLSNPESTLRSGSLTLVILDEAAFIPSIDEAWTAIAPTLSINQKRAAENNIPYGTAIISTPNKKVGTGAWYFKRWMDANQNPKSIFVPFKIHWRQIEGLDDEWYEKQKALLEFDDNKIKQELDLEFVGLKDSLFSSNIQSILNNIEDPQDTTIINNEDSAIWIFNKPKPHKFYLIGVDAASASGNDYSAIEVIDYETMEQVLEFKGKLEPLFLSKYVKKIARLYQNNLIIIENTGGYGLTILNDIMYNSEGETFNIYGEEKIRETKVSGKSRNQFIPGLSTNTKTRPLILDALYEAIRENTTDIVKSKRLAMELLSLVNKKDKVEAETGCHDDLSLAIAFTFYVRKYDHESILSTKGDLQTSIFKQLYDINEDDQEISENESIYETIYKMNIEDPERLTYLENIQLLEGNKDSEDDDNNEDDFDIFNLCYVATRNDNKINTNQKTIFDYFNISKYQ